MKKIVFALLLACVASTTFTLSPSNMLPKKKKSKEAAVLKAVGGFLSTVAGIYGTHLGATQIFVALLPENHFRSRQLTFAGTQIGLSLLLAKYGYETTKNALQDLEEIAQESN